MNNVRGYNDDELLERVKGLDSFTNPEKKLFRKPTLTYHHNMLQKLKKIQNCKKINTKVDLHKQKQLDFGQEIYSQCYLVSFLEEVLNISLYQ